VVTGFFPGRIRLRAPLFKDAALTERMIAVLKQAAAVTHIEHNPLTGSILLEYDPDRLPLKKLQPLLPFFKRLEKEAAVYSAKNKPVIFSLLNELEEYIKGWEAS